jgi:hypothetical protein
MLQVISVLKHMNTNGKLGVDVHAFLNLVGTR